MGVRFVELDALPWEANWTPASAEVFRARVDVATAGDAWIVDGNYHAARDVLLPRADTAIWLDYPLVVILARLFPRTVRRMVRHEVLWGNNIEPTGLRVFSRDSLFVWLLRAYWRKRREYPSLFVRPEFPHLRIVRFRLPTDADAWLQCCVPAAGSDPSQSGPRLSPGA